MEEPDRLEFGALIASAGELYGRELSAAAIDLWWRLCRPIPLDGFRRQLARVREGLEGIPEPDESTVALSRRSGEIDVDLEVIAGAADPETVSWCETRERSVALRASVAIRG